MQLRTGSRIDKRFEKQCSVVKKPMKRQGTFATTSRCLGKDHSPESFVACCMQPATPKSPNFNSLMSWHDNRFGLHFGSRILCRNPKIMISKGYHGISFSIGTFSACMLVWLDHPTVLPLDHPYKPYLQLVDSFWAAGELRYVYIYIYIYLILSLWFFVYNRHILIIAFFRYL